MSTLFKDYRKDAKDLLTKSFTEGGEWKVENKGKAPRGSYAVASTVSTRGGMHMDVEGLSQDGVFYGKLTCASPNFRDVKATLRAENVENHRIEAVIRHDSSAANDLSLEVNHQTVKPVAGGRLSIHDTFTQKAVELGLSVAASEGVQIGCGTTYDVKSNTLDWTTACRVLTRDGILFTAQVNRSRSFAADVLAKAPLHPNFNPYVAATVTLNTQLKSWDVSVGLEWACQVIYGNTAKLRLNRNLDWVAAYVAHLRGGWTLAVSVDQRARTGLTLTRY